MFTCSIIHNNQKGGCTPPPQCPWAAEWVKKMWSIHEVEYNSALKRNDILTQANTWLNLEDITLSGARESRAKYCEIPLT